MANIVNFYDINESELTGKTFSAGDLCYCTDTRNLYFDSPKTKTRVRISADIIILATETERTQILAAIPDKIYCVLDSGRMYLYHSGKWYQFGGNKFNIHGVSFTGNETVVENESVKYFNKADFIPDSSIADLVTESSCTCTDGHIAVTVTLTEEEATYPIFGHIEVY